MTFQDGARGHLEPGSLQDCGRKANSGHTHPLTSGIWSNLTEGRLHCARRRLAVSGYRSVTLHCFLFTQACLSLPPSRQPHSFPHPAVPTFPAFAGPCTWAATPGPRAEGFASAGSESAVDPRGPGSRRGQYVPLGCLHLCLPPLLYRHARDNGERRMLQL